MTPETESRIAALRVEMDKAMTGDDYQAYLRAIEAHNDAAYPGWRERAAKIWPDITIPRPERTAQQRSYSVAPTVG